MRDALDIGGGPVEEQRTAGTKDRIARAEELWARGPNVCPSRGSDGRTP